MEESFGQRLSRIRKEKGLTQEEIAKRIVISPQAVSKWENDASLPDILVLSSLADILGVSVDELLGREAQTTGEEAKTEVVDDEEKYQEDEEDDDDDDDECETKKERGTIHIKDGDDEIIIDSHGVHLSDGEDTVDINGEIHIKGNKGKNVSVDKDGVHVFDKDGNEIKTKHFREESKFSILSSGLLFGVALIAYVLMGIFWTDQTMGWKAGWIVFLIPPVVTTGYEAIRRKRICAFAYPVLVTAVYLTLGFLGMYLGFEGWGFYWFLFITIPAFYLIGGTIDTALRRHRIN